MGSGLDAAKGIWVSRSPNRLGFFKISQRRGRKKKTEKKRKKGMRGEGLGFPLRRHRHLLPAQSPCLCQASPGTKPKICFVSGSAWGAPVGMALHSISSLPASPASCALELAAQMWPDRTAGAKPGVQQLGHICPGAGTGGGQPCLGGSHAPHFPAQLCYQDRHMKDVSPEKGCGCQGSVLSIPSLWVWSISSLPSW